MLPEAALSLELQQLELSLFNIDIRATHRMAELLTDDFVEFGSSGTVHTKDEVIASLQSEAPALFTVEHMRVRQLSPQTALVTYRACRHTDPPTYSLRASIWLQGPRGWRMLFHQGTPSPAP